MDWTSLQISPVTACSQSPVGQPWSWPSPPFQVQHTQMPSMNEVCKGNLVLLSVPLHSVEKVGGARHCLGSNGEKRRNTRQCLNTTFSYCLISLCNTLQTRMLYTIVSSFGFSWNIEDLQKWHLSLLYLGSLLCCG